MLKTFLPINELLHKCFLHFHFIPVMTGVKYKPKQLRSISCECIQLEELSKLHTACSFRVKEKKIIFLTPLSTLKKREFKC